MDKASGAGGDVDVFAHQVAVNARDKILQVQVDVFNFAVQFGGNIVAHPFRVQAAVQIRLGGDEGAARFGHFLPVYG